MHLIAEQGVGIFLLLVLALQGGAMLVFTGRFLQIKPEGQITVMVENCLNTAILILFIPLIAVLLITGWYQRLDATVVAIGIPWLIYGLEAIGMALIICGTALILLGFLALRKTFQPGGIAPRSQDRLVTWGIYSVVRNPLSAGVLSMTLGLALIIQSLFVIALFVIYLILVLHVLSIEENQLSEAFAEEYRSYCQKVKRLVPFIY
jgi:protein-S-isoprenylcysteine O-methyltransferase Ste14